MAPKRITKLIRLSSAETITRTGKYIVKKEKGRVKKGFLGIKSLCIPQYAVTRHINKGLFVND